MAAKKTTTTTKKTTTTTSTPKKTTTRAKKIKLTYNPIFSASLSFTAYLAKDAEKIISGKSVVTKEPMIKGLPEVLTVKKGEVIEVTKAQYTELLNLGLVESEDDREARIQREKEIKSHRKVGVVVQTTQRITTLNKIVEYLTSITKEIHIANTICASTSMRQSEAKELAKESDLVIVVGSRKSANTTHLAEILKDITNTIHIENDTELDNYRDLIKKSQKIGITAGASTPQSVIEKVIEKLK